MHLTTLAGGGKRTAAPQIQDVQITPNPAHDVLLIELSLETESALKISLFDQQGKQVRREQSPTLAAGVQVYKMNDLQSLADGIYILRVQTEEGIIQKKLVLQHNR
ncbi:MAG: T9SS type A sorting domain-containing protein [Bacteroidota bacterium]